MKYPKWAPKLLLAATLAMTSCDFNKTTNNIKQGIKQKVENIVYRYQVEFIKNGRNRLIRVRGNAELNTLHEVAEKRFIKELEKEIKNPRNFYIMANFKTNVEKENGEYIFEYSLDLNPAGNLPPQRVVDMRGTVWIGKNAKAIVEKENNKKIPGWKKRMKSTYSNVFIEDATSNKDNIFHKAFLAKGGY